VVLIEEGRVFTGSAAVLRIARRLRFPWPLAASMLMIPRPLRDWIYARVARRRYRWFGKREHCVVPTPALRSRFID
jgi:predicted DCC family thiol-disulfide oxidoreductase YuxK